MHRLRAGAIGLAALGAAAWSAAAGEVPVALPPFLVEEPTKGPPWRYGVAAGFEILSRCDEATTRRIVATHDRLQQQLAEILPPALQLRWALPKTLVLYDEELQPKSSQEVIAQLLRERPEPPPVELELPGGRYYRSAPARRISFLPNLRLWDRDGLAIFMIVRQETFDPDRLSLTHDYVTFLAKSRVPALPPWFVVGFLELHRQATYGSGGLRVPPLEWPAPLTGDAAKKDPASGVAPLAAFFAAAMPAVEGETRSPAKRWQAQAALLVRWGLEPRERGRREAFFRFVERSAAGGTREEIFRECFGFDYAAAQARLAAYLPAATRREAVYRPAKFVPLPAYALAPATDAQIARIKGDWERLQVPYVKTLFPAAVPKYLEQARRTLARGRERAPTDPALLAVSGLCELDAGDTAAARRWLEAAAVDGATLRPRASYELARLRLAERRAAPAGEGGLDAGQLAEVLQPLFAARAQEPPLAEVYEGIADAWSASATPPTRRHLAVLDEGVRLFPRRAALAVRAAEVYAQFGFREEADVLAELAARFGEADAAVAERLARLRPAAPP